MYAILALVKGSCLETLEFPQAQLLFWNGILKKLSLPLTSDYSSF
jgi:hypothetical protein